MIEFRKDRKAQTVHWHRSSFLAEATMKDGGQGVTNKQGRFLCHAMARAVAPRSEGDLPGPFSGQEKNKALLVPWLTMVIGSGCSSGAGSGIPLSVATPDQIGAALHAHGALPDGQSMADLATRFADRIISDRLPGVETTPVKSVEPWHADLVLATALLTRLYQEGAAATESPLGRWGHHRVTFRAGPQMVPELRTRLLQPYLQHQSRLLAVAPTAVVKLLGAIENGLEQHVLSLLHVQLLTEYAWMNMVAADSAYPGWSELLIFLYRQHEDDGSLAPPLQCPPKPHFASHNDSVNYVVDRYRDATAASWTRRQYGDKSKPSFHDVAARVLREQCVVRSSAQAVDKPPPVSAFVTSFDLELELALLRTDVPGFVVAVPVNLYYSNKASLCWLGAIIPSGSSFEALQTPTDWFLFDKWDEDQPYSNWPIVVRLTGCPLLSLAEVRLVSSNDKPGRTGGGVTIDPESFFSTADQAVAPAVEDITHGHALLLDDYVAIQQHSSEALSSSALPWMLTGAGRSALSRFWLVIGVQMDDPSIRYRVAAKFGANPKNEKALRQDKIGLMVSRTLNASARDLLQWYGFDLVQDTCDEFIPDLGRYADHLNGLVLPHRHFEPCTIPVEKGRP